MERLHRKYYNPQLLAGTHFDTCNANPQSNPLMVSDQFLLWLGSKIVAEKPTERAI